MLNAISAHILVRPAHIQHKPRPYPPEVASTLSASPTHTHQKPRPYEAPGMIDRWRHDDWHKDAHEWRAQPHKDLMDRIEVGGVTSVVTLEENTQK